MTSATGKKKPSLCCRFSFCFLFFSLFLLLLPRSGSSSVRRLCDQLNDGPPEAAIVVVVVVVVAFVETNCTHSLIANCALPPQATKSRFRHVTVIAVSQFNLTAAHLAAGAILSLSLCNSQSPLQALDHIQCVYERVYPLLWLAINAAV